MSDPQTPTLQAVLFQAVQRAQRGIRQALPARVETYDEATRKVSVQPLLLEAYEDGAGTRQIETLPIITNVPVVFPGSGGARVRFPINAGDTVLLIFSSASLDRWLVRGGMLDPGDDRNHDINDCFALPGVQSFAEASDAGPLIEFTSGGEIHAGGNQALALFSAVNDLRTWLSTHKHSGVTTGAGISGPPDPTSGTLPAVIASDVLKGG